MENNEKFAAFESLGYKLLIGGVGLLILIVLGIATGANPLYTVDEGHVGILTSSPPSH